MNRKKLILITCILLFLSFAYGEIELLNSDIYSGSSHSFSVIQYTPNKPVSSMPQSKLGIIIEPILLESEISPCQEGNFSFRLINPSQKSVAYRFEITRFKGIAYIAPGIIVNPGQSKVIQAKLMPECSVSGDINPKIVVNALGYSQEAIIPLILHIKSEYMYSAFVAEEIDLCNGAEARVTGKIKNLANLGNNYSIKADKPYVKPEYDRYSLKENSEGEFSLFIMPDFETESFSEVSLEITPLYGEPSLKRFIIHSENCYGQEIRLEKSEVCELDETIEINVKNTGKYPEQFELVSEFDLERDSFVVAPGEDANFKISLKDVKPGRHELIVDSYMKGKPGFTKQLKADVEVLSREECFEPELRNNKLAATHERKETELEIRNNGIKDETYTLTLESLEWATIWEKEIHIPAGLTGTVKLITWPYPEVKQGSHKASLILKSQQTSNNYVEELVINISDYTLIELFLINKCIIIFIVLILLSLLFFVKFVFDIRDSRKKALVDLLIVFAMLFLATIPTIACFDSFKTIIGIEYKSSVNGTANFCNTYYSEDICSSDYYIRIPEDSTYELDLTERFYDPDEDTLEYTTAGADMLEIAIEGEKAVIIPDKNWNGAVEIFFNANDGRGGYAESRKFYLHVLDKEEFYIEDFLLENHIAISLIASGIFALLSAIIIVALFNWQETGKKK